MRRCATLPWGRKLVARGCGPRVAGFMVLGWQRAGWKAHSCAVVLPVVAVFTWSVRGRVSDWRWSPLAVVSDITGKSATAMAGALSPGPRSGRRAGCRPGTAGWCAASAGRRTGREEDDGDHRKRTYPAEDRLPGRQAGCRTRTWAPISTPSASHAGADLRSDRRRGVGGVRPLLFGEGRGPGQGCGAADPDPYRGPPRSPGSTRPRCGPGRPRRRKYVHGAFTELYSAFYLGTRGLETTKEAGILPFFSGIVASDRCRGYYGETWQGFAGHQACTAHLLRDLEDCAGWPEQA